MSRSALLKMEMRGITMQGGAPLLQPPPPMYPPPPHLVGVPYYPPPPEEEDQKRNELPMHGNTENFNLNNLLAQNIMSSEYFKALGTLKTYHELVDEIYNKVTNVEPWSTGTSRIPSTAFCILMKFFLMRLTERQMHSLLRHTDSPYIRCTGFLYLRYTCPPKDLWSWYEPYLDDEEEFAPGGDPNIIMTMGTYVVKLLQEIKYYGTMLPRIPILIERKIKVLLLLHEEKAKRAAANRRIQGRLLAGAKVRAIYADDENDPAWYDAEILSVDEGPKYLVKFTEYGNEERVGLGEIQLIEEKNDQTSQDARPRSRSKSKSKSRSPKKIKQVKKRSRSRSKERRDRDRSRDRDRDRNRNGDRERDRSKDRKSKKHRSRSRSRNRDRNAKRDRSKDRSDKPESSKDQSKRRHRSSSRSRKDLPTNEDSTVGASLLESGDLMAEVLKRERNKVTAVGKDYASRPASFKGSLALKTDRFTHRKKSRSHSPPPVERRRRYSPEPRPASPKRSGAIIDQEKMRKLKERYGDASSRH